MGEAKRKRMFRHGPVDSSGDNDILVELTDDGTAHCIRIKIMDDVGVLTQMVLHTRSAIDLQHKLSLAITSWIGNAFFSTLSPEDQEILTRHMRDQGMRE